MTKLEMLQKKSLETIEKDPYPIRVTGFHAKGELGSWVDWFQKKKIKNVLKPNKYGSFAIFREVTGEEIDEIKTGGVVIQNRSFCEVRESRDLKK